MKRAVYQITFSMGSGDEGAEINELLEKQMKRFDTDNASHVLRIALRMLEKMKDEDISKESERLPGVDFRKK